MDSAPWTAIYLEGIDPRLREQRPCVHWNARTARTNEGKELFALRGRAVPFQTISICAEFHYKIQVGAEKTVRIDASVWLESCYRATQYAMCSTDTLLYRPINVVCILRCVSLNQPVVCECLFSLHLLFSSQLATLAVPWCDLFAAVVAACLALLLVACTPYALSYVCVFLLCSFHFVLLFFKPLHAASLAIFICPVRSRVSPPNPDLCGSLCGSIRIKG